MRQACSCADRRAASRHRRLHLVFPDQHVNELLSAVLLLWGFHCSDAADDLRPFFEEHIIQREGQDILYYDRSIDPKSICNSLSDVIARFQNQRFLLLLHSEEGCQPSRMDPKEKWKNIEGLLETYDSNSRPQYYVRVCVTSDSRFRRSFLPTHILASIATSLSCAITC